MPDSTTTSRPLHYGRTDRRVYNPYYRHTGRLTARGLLATCVLAIPVAVALAIGYAYADLYVPITFVDAGLALAFGAAMGGTCGLVLRWGKVRNVPVSLALTAVLTLVAYYVCWAAWLCAAIDRLQLGGRTCTVVGLAVRPHLLASEVLRINARGTWSWGPDEPSRTNSRLAQAAMRPSASPHEFVRGSMLWWIWAGEAAVILGGALGVVRIFGSKLPYCEACGRWCDPSRRIARIGAGAAAFVRAEMEGGRYGALAALVGGEHRDHFWAVSEHRCRGCRRFHTVSIDEVIRTMSQGGREETHQRPVVRRLIVSPEQMVELRAALDLSTDPVV